MRAQSGVQVNVAQTGNSVLAGQAQPQPVTPWSPPPNPPPGNLTAKAFITGFHPGFRESWFTSTPSRWCKPSTQDPVTGPGEPQRRHSSTAECVLLHACI